MSLRCSDASLARSEPLYGTASFVRRWLLVEQPGAWGHDALMQSRMPLEVGAELRRRARAAATRVILIRRGVRFSSEGRQCYFLRTGEGDLYQAQLKLDRVDDLLDIDLTPLREGGAVEGAEDRRDPLFLVCTHGRHDACCSIRGNQVSRIACAHPEAPAWECSHIGGDRFAANLVCFPHGVYYGRVTPADVVGLMDDYARARLSLDHYRGRCCYPFAVQAAEYFVRRASATVAVDAVSLLAVSEVETGIAAAFAVSGNRQVDVQVRVEEAGEYRLTCGSSSARPIPRYELVSCTLGPIGAAP